MALRIIPATGSRLALEVLVKDVTSKDGRHTRPVVVIGMLHSAEEMPEIRDPQARQLARTISGEVAALAFEGVPEIDGTGNFVRVARFSEQPPLVIPEEALVLGGEHIWHNTLSNLGTMVIYLKIYRAIGIMTQRLNPPPKEQQAARNIKQTLLEQRAQAHEECLRQSTLILDRVVRPGGFFHRHFSALTRLIPQKLKQAFSQIIDAKGNIRGFQVRPAWEKDGDRLNQPGAWLTFLRALSTKMIEAEGPQYGVHPGNEMARLLDDLFRLPPGNDPSQDPRIVSLGDVMAYYPQLQGLDTFQPVENHMNPS